MCKPYISVIIPAYNAQEHIRECLESVLAQSFRDFEVVVVNDGSQDRTKEIVDSIAKEDARITQITTTNMGTSCARNSGIGHAKGRWITFLDSDDMLFPEALQLLVDAQKLSGCNIVAGGWTDRWHKQAKSDRSLKITTYESIQFIEKILFQTKDNNSVWAKLFLKELIADVKFAPGLWYEDLDYCYRAHFKVPRIALTNSIIYYYRNNPASFIHTFSKKRLDALEVTKRMEEYMRLHCPLLLPAARDRRLSANFNIYALLMKYTAKNEFTSIKQECWHLITKYRKECIFSRKTRLKNKLGALLSLCGQKIFMLVAAKFY